MSLSLKTWSGPVAAYRGLGLSILNAAESSPLANQRLTASAISCLLGSRGEAATAAGSRRTVKPLTLLGRPVAGLILTESAGLFWRACSMARFASGVGS